MCNCLDAGQVDIHNKSANFDWNEHMSALKILAASPGITLYTGRRMFSSDGDTPMYMQQFTQLSQPNDCQMEMVIFLRHCYFRKN